MLKIKHHPRPNTLPGAIFHQATPPPPQFTPTSRAGGFTHPKGTPMTHEQYVDLKNEYRAMAKELKRYNELKSSQMRSTRDNVPKGQLWIQINSTPKR